MNCDSQIYDNIMVSYFKLRYSTSYGKISFTPVKGIHMNNDEKVCVKYVTENTSTLKIYWDKWNFCQSASQLL